MRRTHIKSSAEKGFLRGSKITEDEIFPQMSTEMDVYGKDRAVWMANDKEAAKIYGWGGGYFEIKPDNLKVVEDQDSCYAVVMSSRLSLDHVDTIRLEQTDGPRDHLMEVANLLDEKHRDIELGVYDPPSYNV